MLLAYLSDSYDRMRFKIGHIKEYRAHQDITQPKKHTLRMKANHP